MRVHGTPQLKIKHSVGGTKKRYMERYVGYVCIRQGQVSVYSI